MTTATASPTILRWSTVAALYLCLALVYCWTLLPAMGSALPNDTGDPGLIAFLLWWNAHAVPFTERWWNAPMFFPQAGVLAFSDTMLGMSPFSSPLLWAGASAVQAHNVLFIASIVAAALSAHALARHLTGRHDVAIIAGLAFGFSPYRASQMPHLHLLVTCWMPLALLAAHRYLQHRRRTDLVLLGVCWMMNGLTSAYYLVFFTVLLGLWMLWFVRERRDWLAMGLSLAVAAIPVAVMVLTQKRILDGFGLARDPAEIATFSADLTAFLAVSRFVWLPRHWTLPPQAEGELYPGLAIVFLTVAAAVVLWRRVPRPATSRVRRWAAWIGGALVVVAWLSWMAGGWRVDMAGLEISLTRPYRVLRVGVVLLALAVLSDPRVVDIWRRRSTFAFYALAALAMAVLCLGPVVRVNGVTVLEGAPYAWLMALPGGDALRVPARFAMLMMLCLAQAASIALLRLRPGGPRAAVVALTAVLVLADGWVPKMQVARVEAMAEIPRQAPDTVVLEIPIRTLWTETAAMLRATGHGYPVANGFSGYGPLHYHVMVDALQHADASVVDVLRARAPVLVLVNRHRDQEGGHEAFARRMPESQFLSRTAVGPLFSMPAKAPRASSPGEPVAIARIEAAGAGALVAAMIDGDLATQWHTLAPQTAGDQVRVVFDGEVSLSRIEMDMGEALMYYPRRLRIDAVAADGRAATVWHDNAGGLAMLAAMHDRSTGTLVIDLPADTRAQALTLTLTDSRPDVLWSIAELRAFGRDDAR